MSPNRKQIEQGLGCGDHVAHAEFAFLTSNFGGQLTRGGGVAESQLLDNLKIIGKLAAQAFFEPTD